MPKKLSYDYVKNYIEKDNYTLLSDTYINANTKLKIRCDKGHEYEVIFNTFKRGGRCAICAGKKKHTYDEVKQYIEKENYTLLSNSYKNNNTKLKVRCDKGHEYEVKFNTFQQGHRCAICAGKKKHTYDEVKQYIEKENYTLLSDTYKNGHTKLKVRCPENHEYKVSFKDFKTGYRCPVCANTTLSYDYVKQYIEKQGYTLLSDTYKNAKTKLKVRCDKGHEYEVTFGNFKKGGRCNICRTENKKLSYDYVKQYIKSFDYTLLSKEYVNANTKLKVRCDKGHEYEVTFGNFQQGWRCPICNIESTSSKGEKEVAEFVKNLLYDKDVICNDRTQIVNPLTGYNLELDVFVPELKIAIEYNGSYWHSLSKAVKKDKIKVEQCRKRGINLLIVEDEKWKEDKQLEMKRIEKWIKNVC